MIKISSSSFGLSVQDLGRIGFASYGVPISGTMDQYSSKLANKILNNNEHDAVLEITNGGCKLEFHTATCICITGANYTPKLDGAVVGLNKPINIVKGSVLSFAKKQLGCRTYVAVKHGIKTIPVLNSRSMFSNITSASILKKGDQVFIDEFSTTGYNSSAKVKIEAEHFLTDKIHAFKGPEFEVLNHHQIKRLKEQVFTISKHNNRMGYQLEEHIENSISSMLTSSVLPGSVQLTPSGKIIVLMRDCQVTGGYPRILQLSEASINVLAQKTSGESIKFIIQTQ